MFRVLAIAGAALAIVGSNVARCEMPKVFAEGSISTDRKNAKLTTVTAYRIRSDGKDAIAVLVSEGPVKLRDLRFFPPDNPKWIDLRSIGLVPHVQLVFDDKTGKPLSMQGWVDNMTIVVDPPNSTLQIEASIDGEFISGATSREINTRWPVRLQHAFDAKFCVKIEDLKKQDMH